MINWHRMLNVRATFVLALAVLMAACSDDKMAGGTTEDAGIIANLNVAGLAQKGPFVKGSVVTLQGVDCKTMDFTDEVFEGSVINDDGEYVVENVNLSVACALLEVTGYYLNENTGKRTTGEISLHALTDLSDRKNVNINVFTELEYKRVMNLVTEKKKSFADAKKQAEKEVLAAFDVKAEDGDLALFEDLDVFEKGKVNEALHDVSVMLQADLDATKLAERLEDIASDIAKDGKWDDRSSSSNVIASSSSVIPASSGNLPSSSGSLVNAYLNPDIEYGEMTDPRDGRVYKIVSIDRRFWMAENLDYADSVNMPSLKGRSWCYQNKPENCATMGRLYSWAAAIDSSKLVAEGKDCGAGKTCGLRGPVQGVCPDGWHLPTKVEWVDMWEAIAGNEAWNVAGSLLKSKTGWNNDANGSDDYGFSAAPAGFKAGAAYGYFGEYARFWSSTENEEAENGTASSNRNAYNVIYGLKDDPQLSGDDKAYGMSVRCVANDGRLDWTVPKESYLNPDIDYGELTDSRDGQVYKTVKIGNQTWMAQNLNYADSVKTPSLKGNSWCFGDKPKRCKVGGRLYTWAAAIDSVGLAKDPDNPRDCGYNKECPFTESVHGICPDGWHLPSRVEFDTLVATVGGKEIAERNLRSRIGWSLYETGSDSFGFSAIPVGRRLYDRESGNVEFLFSGLSVDFWSSSEYYTGAESSPTTLAYKLHIYDDQNSSPVVIVGKGAGYSVRCLKD